MGSGDEESQYFGLVDGIAAIGANLRLLVIAPIIAGLLGLAIAFASPKTYTGVTRILPPQQSQNSAAAMLATQLGSLAGIAGAAAGIKNPSDVYVSMLKSRTVAEHLLKQFNLREVYDAKFDEDAHRELADRTRITAGKDGLIVVEVEDRGAQRAADMANAYVAALRTLTQSLAVTEAAQRRLFFDGQLKQAREDLTKSEIALRGSGINEGSLKAVPQSALEALARLKAQVTAQEVRLAAMRGFMTESNPEYVLAQQELAALRVQLAKAGQIDSALATSSGAEYIAKFRDFKYHEALYELMAKQYEVARLDEAREGAIIQVVDAAVPPQRHTRPKKGLTAILASIAGLIAAIAYIFIRRWWRTVQENPDVAKTLRASWGFGRRA